MSWSSSIFFHITFVTRISTYGATTKTVMVHCIEGPFNYHHRSFLAELETAKMLEQLGGEPEGSYSGS